MNGKAKGAWLALVAALTCPCHLPLLAFALTGTAAGALLADNIVAALAIMALAFVLSPRVPSPARKAGAEIDLHLGAEPAGVRPLAGADAVVEPVESE